MGGRIQEFSVVVLEDESGATLRLYRSFRGATPRGIAWTRLSRMPRRL